MHKINPKIDKISERLNVDGDILGNFWPKEIKFIKEEYRTIPFPFKEINAPKFKMKRIGICINCLIICKHGQQ